MNSFKRRVATFLSLVLALTTVFSVAPQKKEVVYAEEYSFLSVWLDIIVEVGEKDLYAGDLVAFEHDNEFNFGSRDYLSGLSGVTYKSSDDSVLEVDKNGYLTPKAVGEAVISVFYQGYSTEINVDVIRKFSDEGINVSELLKDKYNEVTNMESYGTKEKNACKKFVKVYGNGATVKNRYQILKAGRELMKVCQNIKSFNGTYRNEQNKRYIIAPEGIHAMVCLRTFTMYGNRISPFSTGYGKNFKIKSIKATKKQVTINLKSKVTKEQIFGMASQGMGSSKVKLGKSNKSISFPVELKDSEDNGLGIVTATTKVGSSKIIIKIKNGINLRSGKTYRLAESWSDVGDNGWLDTEAFIKKYKEFKVK